MRILDKYYREGAPSAVAVPMSDACRSSTLTLRASSNYIFDRARAELLQTMGIVIEPLQPVRDYTLYARRRAITTMYCLEPPASQYVSFYVQQGHMTCCRAQQAPKYFLVT